MKCTNCGGYTFDEHNICVKCAEERGVSSYHCTSNKCKELHA